MTLERLLELYQAEQMGKTIMCRTILSGYYECHTYTNEVKITQIDLKDLIIDEEDGRYLYFYIKDEETEYGEKIIM